jgi:hypothetical protein
VLLNLVIVVSNSFLSCPRMSSNLLWSTLSSMEPVFLTWTNNCLVIWLLLFKLIGVSFIWDLSSQDLLILRYFSIFKQSLIFRVRHRKWLKWIWLNISWVTRDFWLLLSSFRGKVGRSWFKLFFMNHIRESDSWNHFCQRISLEFLYLIYLVLLFVLTHLTELPFLAMGMNSHQTRKLSSTVSRVKERFGMW